MAEGLFRKAVDAQEFTVSSAGVAAYPGSVASPETCHILEKNEASLSDFRSRMVDAEMLAQADAVFCMTEGHLQTLEMMFPEYEERYHLACDFVEVNGRVGVDVPDPIGMGPKAYEEVAEVLEVAIEGILGYLKA